MNKVLIEVEKLGGQKEGMVPWKGGRVMKCSFCGNQRSSATQGIRAYRAYIVEKGYVTHRT